MHPLVELEEGWDKDNEREGYCQQYVQLGTLEDVNELNIGIGIDVVDKISSRVVGPMISHARKYAARTPIHPTKK